MSSIKTILSASAIAFLTLADAHMIMATPKPYGSPNNSPLVADGSDFPCKGASSSGGPSNDMTIGAPINLSFTGSAVHGGGSCQISLTKDSPPTKDTVWQVIHSIVGGCPAKNQAGNLGGPGEGADNPAMPDPDTYTFSIPQGIAPGAYTLAWTWFNKIGNREMYMNCALVNVKGGSAKREPSQNETYAIPELTERDTSFPDMFKANIGNGCTSADSKDVLFPNPGPSVEKDGQPADLAPPTGNCGSAGASSGSSASPSGASGASPSAAAASGGAASASSPSAAAAAPAASGPADSSANAASGASPSGAAPLAAPSPPSNAVSGASSPAAANSSSGAAVGSSSATPDASTGSASTGSTTGSTAAAPATGGTTCSGTAMICSADGTQFGLCNNGNAAMQSVAAGTKCVAGAIQKRAILPRRPFGEWALGLAREV